MPEEVLEVTKKFMRDSIRILVKKEELTLEGIRQFYIGVEKEVILNKNNMNLFYLFIFFILGLARFKKSIKGSGKTGNKFLPLLHKARRKFCLFCLFYFSK